MEPISLGRAVVELAKNLIPPHEGDERVYRWRLFVAFFVGANTMANIGHIAWACGWLSFAGLHGFVTQEAYAFDIKQTVASREQINTKIDYIQRAITNNLLKETMKVRCIAILQNNQAALDSANTELGHYEEQYYALFQRSYVEQPCSVVLIAKEP